MKFIPNEDNSIHIAWWCHQMGTFFALLALCAGNSPVPGEFPSQRPMRQSFDVFFDLCLNKHLSKHLRHLRRWWFEMPSRSLWCHCNGIRSIPWLLFSQVPNRHSFDLTRLEFPGLSTSRVKKSWIIPVIVPWWSMLYCHHGCLWFGPMMALLPVIWASDGPAGAVHPNYDRHMTADCWCSSGVIDLNYLPRHVSYGISSHQGYDLLTMWHQGAVFMSYMVHARFLWIIEMKEFTHNTSWGVCTQLALCGFFCG